MRTYDPRAVEIAWHARLLQDLVQWKTTLEGIYRELKDSREHNRAFIYGHDPYIEREQARAAEIESEIKLCQRQLEASIVLAVVYESTDDVDNDTLQESSDDKQSIYQTGIAITNGIGGDSVVVNDIHFDIISAETPMAQRLMQMFRFRDCVHSDR